jgi:hypothetical protein
MDPATSIRVVTALMSALASATAWAQSSDLRLATHSLGPEYSSWRFAGQANRVDVVPPLGLSEAPRITWTVAVGDRVLASGVEQVDHRLSLAATDGAAATVAITTPPLDVRPGVVLTAELKAIFHDIETPGTRTQRLYVASREFSAPQRQIFERAALKVFDTQNQLAELLDKEEIPYERLRRLADIDAVSDGWLIVPEGASFRLQPQLAPSLLKAAERGAFVVCFTPKDGSFPLPNPPSGQLHAAKSLRFASDDFLAAIDKRLANRTTTTPCVALGVRDGDIRVELGGDASQWHALDVEFSPYPPRRSPGRFLVLGMPLANSWNSNPAVRYALMALAQERLDFLANFERPRQ